MVVVVSWRGIGLYAFIVLLVAVLYRTVVSSVGYISDDWDLLERISNVPFYAPIENHHYNLFVNFLFKSASVGALTPYGIHLIALIGHLANTFLVYLIARRGFACDTLIAWTVALLFSISPAGIEAVTWCCAIGYIASAFWIFLGIYTATTNLSYKPLWFFLIQLLAFASWDWGMLVFPTLCVMAVVDRRTSRLQLLPVASCWVGVLVLKKVFGLSLGYVINSPIVFFKNLLSAPLVTVLPQFSKNFYQSPIGILAALSVLTILIVYSFRNRTVLLMTVLFFVCQLPQAVMGHPQSRYAYIAAFPLLFAFVLITRASFKRYAILPLSLLAVLYFVWTEERVQWWQEAFIQMQHQQRAIHALSHQHGELVVVDLPDRYGPYDKIWLPQGWRNGRNIFSSDVLFYSTPQSLPAYKISGMEELSLEEIMQRHPHAYIYDAS